LPDASTKYEQGAWWQVDLGGQKNIKQIIIYTPTPTAITTVAVSLKKKKRPNAVTV
jgi:hypothetical protein